VDTPDHTFDVFAFVLGAFRRPDAVVEPDEVKRRSNPGSAGNDVKPPGKEMEPVIGVCVEQRGPPGVRKPPYNSPLQGQDNLRYDGVCLLLPNQAKVLPSHCEVNGS